MLEKVKKSLLYDSALGMYVLNEPLDDQPDSLGQAMATAEYLTMWSEFLLGQRPIVMEDGKPVFRPSPLLPANLFRKDGSLEFVLFGSTQTRYENPDRINLFGESYRIELMRVRDDDGERDFIDHLMAPEVNKLRSGKMESLKVVFRAC